jgi:hypothetical protein
MDVVACLLPVGLAQVVSRATDVHVAVQSPPDPSGACEPRAAGPDTGSWRIGPVHAFASHRVRSTGTTTVTGFPAGPATVRFTQAGSLTRMPPMYRA